MSVLDAIEPCFAASYAEARDRFRAACKARGVAPRTYDNPNLGPRGEPLATDVAWVGTASASRVMVLVSGTHGAEGFCGSGCQLDWLRERHALPDDVAVLLVHAINPHGFAWIRRVTEEGCDLNRNFVDFDAPLPENPGHDALVDCFVPASLDDETIRATEARIAAYRAEHGETAFQSARKAGQYRHAHSVFFGGFAPTWARRTLEAIIADHDLPTRRWVSVVDYHTGLGPFGYGEPICDHPLESEAMRRVLAMYGDSVGVPELGTSSSIPLHGTARELWSRMLGEHYTYVALEYGTYATDNGRIAMRADHWLHAQGAFDWDAPHAREIKSALRRQFYPDTPDWKEMVLWRSRQVQRQTLAGLAAPG
ncbi:MAG: DUF2817 domain-containing protein [Ectothiorhodospiraceae bacterium]|nr:DUF2817 domain-containing protein [Ectothiorhodospiraceae bacterium]